MNKLMGLIGAVVLSFSATESWGLGVEMRGGLGAGSLNPPKVDTAAEAAASANVFCGEGSLGIRLNKRVSGGVAVSWSISKYDQAAGLAGNWEITQALVAGSLYGQYNFMANRFRPYLRASVGTFGQGMTIVDKATRSALTVVAPDTGLHASGSLGGELAFTKRFYGFLEAQYHSFDVGGESVGQVNAVIGIGYTFANIYDF